VALPASSADVAPTYSLSVGYLPFAVEDLEPLAEDHEVIRELLDIVEAEEMDNLALNDVLSEIAADVSLRDEEALDEIFKLWGDA
jgi:hypothetical protein